MGTSKVRRPEQNRGIRARLHEAALVFWSVFLRTMRSREDPRGAGRRGERAGNKVYWRGHRGGRAVRNERRERRGERRNKSEKGGKDEVREGGGAVEKGSGGTAPTRATLRLSVKRRVTRAWATLGLRSKQILHVWVDVGRWTRQLAGPRAAVRPTTRQTAGYRRRCVPLAPAPHQPCAQAVSRLAALACGACCAFCAFGVVASSTR